MYYIQLLSTESASKIPQPRERIQGPFANPVEAQGYWAKLKMWFPEALEEAKFKITESAVKSSYKSLHAPHDISDANVADLVAP